MANDILITPASGSILFQAPTTGTSNITLYIETGGTSGQTGIITFVGDNAGDLFSITDSLEGSLMSVSDISGIPIFEVFSNDSIIMGEFGSNALVVSGTSVGIGTQNPSSPLDIFGTTNELRLSYSGGIFSTLSTDSGGTLNITSTGNTLISGGDLELSDSTALYWDADSGGTGIRRQSEGNLYFRIAGTDEIWFNANTFEGLATGSYKLRNTTASSSNPTLVPNRTTTNTGIGGDGTTISLITGGVQGLEVDGNQDVTIPAGSLTLPSGTTNGLFFDDGDTGIYQNGTNELLNIDVAGSQRILIGTTITFTGNIIQTATASGVLRGDTTGGFYLSQGNQVIHSFQGDTDTGLDWNSADNISLKTSGLTAINIDSGQTVTIQSGLTLASVPTSGASDQILIRNVSSGNVEYTSLAALGGGDVTKSGTPVDNQVAVWVSSGSIEGDPNFLWTGSQLLVTGDTTISGNTNISGATTTNSTITAGGTITANNANAPMLGNYNATGTVPNIIPDKTDTNTGIGSAAADQLSLIAGGVQAIRLYSTGGHLVIGDMVANGSNGWGLIDETPSTTNPVIIPDKTDETTGMGGATGTISLTVGGTEAINIDASRNVTIQDGYLRLNDTADGHIAFNTTPSAWGTNWYGIQSDEVSIQFSDSGSFVLNMHSNAYYNGSAYRRLLDGAVANVNVYEAEGVRLRTAVSGATDSTITWIDGLQVHPDGTTTIYDNTTVNGDVTITGDTFISGNTTVDNVVTLNSDLILTDAGSTGSPTIRWGDDNSGFYFPTINTWAYSRDNDVKLSFTAGPERFNISVPVTSLSAITATIVNTPASGNSTQILSRNSSTGAVEYTSVADLATGDVTKSGTAVDNQVAVWVSDGSIEGDSNFQWTGTELLVTGNTTLSGSLTVTGDTNITGTTTLDDIVIYNRSGSTSSTTIRWGDVDSGWYFPTIASTSFVNNGNPIITLGGTMKVDYVPADATLGTEQFLLKNTSAGELRKLTIGSGLSINSGALVATGSSTPLSGLTDVTITSIASGELLKWDGSQWVNNTLVEAGIQPAGSYDNYQYWLISGDTGGETINSTNSVFFSGGTDISTTYDSTTNRLRIDFTGAADTNTFLTGATFNTGDGILTLTRNDDFDVTVDLDGRYVELSGGDYWKTTGNTNVTTPTIIGNTTFGGDLTVTGDTFITGKTTTVSGSTGGYWFNDGDSGIIEASDDSLQFYHNGSPIWQINSNRFADNTNTGPAMVNATATLTNPTFRPYWLDSNTGIGGDGSDTLALITSGVTALSIDSGQTATFAGDIELGTNRLYFGAGQDSYITEDATANRISVVAGGSEVVEFRDGQLFMVDPVIKFNGSDGTINNNTGEAIGFGNSNNTIDINTNSIQAILIDATQNTTFYGDITVTGNTYITGTTRLNNTLILEDGVNLNIGETAAGGGAITFGGGGTIDEPATDDLRFNGFSRIYTFTTTDLATGDDFYIGGRLTIGTGGAIYVNQNAANSTPANPTYETILTNNRLSFYNAGTIDSVSTGTLNFNTVGVNALQINSSQNSTFNGDVTITGNTYITGTTRLNNTLILVSTPATGTVADNILLRDSSGNVDQIAFSSVNLSDFTDDVVAGNYLPLSGGTLTGNLTVNADTTITGNTSISGETYISPTVTTSSSDNILTYGADGKIEYRTADTLAGEHAFSGHTDVDITGVQTGSFVYWDGSNWVDTAGTMLWNSGSAFLDLTGGASSVALNIGSGYLNLESSADGAPPAATASNRLKIGNRQMNVWEGWTINYNTEQAGDPQNAFTIQRNSVDVYDINPAGTQHTFSVGGNVALTIDSSQNSTFNGDVTITGDTYITGKTTTVSGSTGGFYFGNGDTYIYESADDNIIIVTSGLSAVTVDSSQYVTLEGGTLIFNNINTGTNPQLFSNTASFQDLNFHGRIFKSNFNSLSWGLYNRQSSATAPVFLTTQGNTDTGIGGEFGEVSLISEGVEKLRIGTGTTYVYSDLTVTGDTYVTGTTRLNNTLILVSAPATGTVADNILLRDSSGNVDQIAFGSVNLSDFTDDILSGSYLPLSGGTLTGNLVMDTGDVITANGTMRMESVSGQELEIVSTRDVRIFIDSNNDDVDNKFEIQSNTSTTNDANIVFYVDQTGNVLADGTISGDSFNIVSAPATGSVADNILLRDSSGDIQQIAFSSVNLSDFTNNLSNLTIGSGLSGSTSTYNGASAVTIVHDDTSSQASSSNGGRTYIQNVSLDQYGHVTGLTSATETVTDTDTTYTHSWVDSGANAILRLTAGGSGAGNDDLTLVAGTNITLTPSGDNLTIDASGGGTTSGGDTNEIQKNDGSSGFTGTKMFSVTNGDLIIGDSTTTGGARNITASGNTASTNLNLIPDGSQGVVYIGTSANRRPLNSLNIDITSNTETSGRIRINNGGGFDPFVMWSVGTDTRNYVMGIDNSDNDTFKLGTGTDTSADTPSNTTNLLTIDPSGNTTLNNGGASGSTLTMSLVSTGDAVLEITADVDGTSGEDTNPRIVFSQDGGASSARIGIQEASNRFYLDTTDDRDITIKTQATDQIFVSNSPRYIELFGIASTANAAVGATTNGVGVLRINEVTTAPAGTLTANGGLLFVSGDTIYYHSSGGTQTDLTAGVTANEGLNTRMAYFTGANTIEGTADLTYSNGTITITEAGAVDRAIVFSDSSNHFTIGMDDTDNGFKISNSSTLGTTDRFEIDSGGIFTFRTGTTGDVHLVFEGPNGSTDWSMGVDDSNSDSFQIVNNTSLTTSEAVTSLTIDASKTKGITSSSPFYHFQSYHNDTNDIHTIARWQASEAIGTSASNGFGQRHTFWLETGTNNLEFEAANYEIHWESSSSASASALWDFHLRIEDGGSSSIQDVMSFKKNTTNEEPAVAIGDAASTSGVTAGYNLELVGSDNQGRAADWTATSDERLKENFRDYGPVLPKIMELDSKLYTYNRKADKKKRTELGMIAQEVLPVFPEIVGGSEKEYYDISYQRMSTINMQGIIELKKENELLKEDIKYLKEEIEKLKNK